MRRSEVRKRGLSDRMNVNRAGSRCRSERSRHTAILAAVEARRTRLRLRVVPGTTHPGIVGRLGDGWKVRVAAAPKGGRANEVVLVAERE